MPSQRDRRGFTLLELLIAAAVVGVLAAATVPAVAALVARQDRMTARGDVVAFLMGQHTRAIESGNVRWMRWEADGHHLIAGDDGQPIDDERALPDDAVIEADGYERLDDRFFETVDPSLAEAGWSREIVFYPDGSATQATLTFKLGASSESVTVHRWSGLVE